MSDILRVDVVVEEKTVLDPLEGGEEALGVGDDGVDGAGGGRNGRRHGRQSGRTQNQMQEDVVTTSGVRGTGGK